MKRRQELGASTAALTLGTLESVNQGLRREATDRLDMPTPASLVLAVVVVAVAVGILVFPAPQAAAHATVLQVGTFPADGEMVAAPPDELVLELSLPPSSVQAVLTAATGEEIAVEVLVDGTEQVRILVSEPLRDGVWLVAFDAVVPHPEREADQLGGGWAFIVGSGAPAGVPGLGFGTNDGSQGGLPVAAIGAALALTAVAMVLAVRVRRRRPELAPAFLLLAGLGLVPAAAMVLSSDRGNSSGGARVLASTTEADLVAGSVELEGMGGVDVNLARVDDSRWRLTLDYRDGSPTGVRVFATVTDRPGSDTSAAIDGGTPLNQWAFAERALPGMRGRFGADLELREPGVWQFWLLTVDDSFKIWPLRLWVEHSERI